MRLVAGCRGQDHKYYLYLLSAKSRSPLITTTGSMMLTDFAILGTSQFCWSQSGLLYAVINGLLLRLEHCRNYETFVICDSCMFQRSLSSRVGSGADPSGITNSQRPDQKNYFSSLWVFPMYKVGVSRVQPWIFPVGHSRHIPSSKPRSQLTADGLLKLSTNRIMYRRFQPVFVGPPVKISGQYLINFFRTRAP